MGTIETTKGNMFDHLNKFTIPVITTNSFIRKDGALAMGRGAALAAKRIFPLLPYDAGRYVEDLCGHLGVYNFIMISSYSLCTVALFQVKRHFASSAELDLIKNSIKQLKCKAQRYPNMEFRLNFPGIGYGGLKREDVEPLLLPLADLDNVSIWEL